MWRYMWRNIFRRTNKYWKVYKQMVVQTENRNALVLFLYFLESESQMNGRTPNFTEISDWNCINLYCKLVWRYMIGFEVLWCKFSQYLQKTIMWGWSTKEKLKTCKSLNLIFKLVHYVIYLFQWGTSTETGLLVEFQTSLTYHRFVYSNEVNVYLLVSKMAFTQPSTPGF